MHQIGGRCITYIHTYMTHYIYTHIYDTLHIYTYIYTHKRHYPSQQRTRLRQKSAEVKTKGAVVKTEERSSKVVRGCLKCASR